MGVGVMTPDLGYGMPPPPRREGGHRPFGLVQGTRREGVWWVALYPIPPFFIPSILYPVHSLSCDGYGVLEEEYTWGVKDGARLRAVFEN